MVNENDITIYCMYHNDNIINDYNLDKLPSYYKLLNLNDTNIEGDNINYLNRYLCELCGYYYIWKNNVYSPYVGFCHYRRLYVSLGLDNLENYGVQYYSNIETYLKYKLSTYFNYDNNFNKLYKYLINKGFDKNILYTYFYEDNIFYCPWKMSYILKWEHFIKVCELVFGFLEYIEPEYKNVNIHHSRKIAWQFELYFGIIVNLYFNHLKLDHTRSFYPFNKILLTKSNCDKVPSNEYNDLLKFIWKNYKTGTLIFIINEHLKQSDIDGGFENVIIIKNKNEIPNEFKNAKIIELELNQYIDTLDPIYFNNDKYIIKTL